MIFTQIPQLVIYYILTFCTLVSITIISFMQDGVSDAVPAGLLAKNLLQPRKNDTIDLLTLGHFCVPKIYPNVDFKGCLK